MVIQEFYTQMLTKGKKEKALNLIIVFYSEDILRT